MGEIMVLKSGEGAGIFGGAFAGSVDRQSGQGVLPARPSAAIANFLLHIAGEKPPRVGRDHVTALVLGDQVFELLPKVREKLPRAAAIKPIQLRLRHQKDAAQNKVGDTVGMRLRIDQGQCRPPAAAKDNPVVNIKPVADHLDVAHQMPCRVVLHAGMGPRTPASALVKQDDPVVIRVKIAPHRRAAPAPRSAMQHHNRLPVRVAALLHIDSVPLTHRQHALIERVNPGIKMRCCAVLS